MTERYAVLATLMKATASPTDVLIMECASWDEAQYVWKGLDTLLHLDTGPDAEPEDWRREVNHLMVRAMDDPRTKLAYRGDGPVWSSLHRLIKDVLKDVQRFAHAEARGYRRSVLGKLAMDAVNDDSLGTLNAVIRRVEERAKEKGLDLGNFEAQDAVKSRVTLGRMHRSDRRNDRMAYFWPKRQGRLDEVTTPSGDRLYQTTLALNAPFFRLPAKVEA